MSRLHLAIKTLLVFINAVHGDHVPAGTRCWPRCFPGDLLLSQSSFSPLGTCPPLRCGVFPLPIFLSCSSVPGHQAPDLPENSLLCLHSPAFSKYSHSSDASSFLIFSILFLFILKSSFVAAHMELGNCGGWLSSLRRPRLGPPAHSFIFHYPPPRLLPENRSNQKREGQRGLLLTTDWALPMHIPGERGCLGLLASGEFLLFPFRAPLCNLSPADSPEPRACRNQGSFQGQDSPAVTHALGCNPHSPP